MGEVSCISEALDDEPSCPYFCYQNIAGLPFPPPHISVEKTDTTPPGNRRIGASTKAAVQCVSSVECVHMSL